MTHLLSFLMVAGLWATVAYLVADSGVVRGWRARRAELARLPKVTTDPPRINRVRRDPSPRPRKRTAA